MFLSRSKNFWKEKEFSWEGDDAIQLIQENVKTLQPSESPVNISVGVSESPEVRKRIKIPLDRIVFEMKDEEEPVYDFVAFDETAQGHWLDFLVTQGLTYLRAHAKYLSQALYETVRIEEEGQDRVHVQLVRSRPEKIHRE